MAARRVGGFSDGFHLVHHVVAGMICIDYKTNTEMILP